MTRPRAALHPSPRRESLLPPATWTDDNICLIPRYPEAQKCQELSETNCFPSNFQWVLGTSEAMVKKKPDQASEPTPLGYLVPWIIFCCCCRISSKPKPLVSSGSSKSQGLGAPRLAPPVIRLDLIRLGSAPSFLKEARSSLSRVTRSSKRFCLRSPSSCVLQATR